MESRCVLIMGVLVISATLIQGFSLPRGNRCLCKQYVNGVNRNFIANLEYFASSANCDKPEVIVTLKRSKKQICLNPEDKQVKNLLSEYIKRRGKN
ncbi:C-X-C motif chemokine 10-like [Discoglossus pictus]